MNIVGRMRNSNYEKDGDTVHGMVFTAEGVDYLDSWAASEARRSPGQHSECAKAGDDDGGCRPSPGASGRSRKGRSERQSAHADA